jgi:glycosyltransferase involved in cell wall biosynthesis
MKIAGAQNGPLAGLTIMRFAHAFESGGGTERYLDDLDRTLLEREAMTIVRVHLTRKSPSGPPIEEKIGLGALIKVPLPILSGDISSADSNEHSARFWLKKQLRNWILYNPLIWRIYGAKWVSSFQMQPQPGQAIGSGPATAEQLRTRGVDLVVLHFFGGADADEVIKEVQKCGVPFCILNHYSNDRLLHLSIRKHAMLADAVAGVNGLSVPRYIRENFTNLSDGIDTSFFRRANARPLASPPRHQIILLPARVVKEKGQMDLVRAVASLHKSGFDCSIAFAGRVDSSGFVEELRHEIARSGMNDRVYFLGVLNLDELRDWYAASAIMALPTYHHEGLPRVVLEAQAMELPVVAYATGGVADGISTGHTGFLVSTGDIRGLTDRLRVLLSSSALRTSMGTAGREAAEARFSLGALADRHERFYRQVLAG